MVTSAMSFGRLVTETNLLLDKKTKDVIRSVGDVGQPPGRCRTITPDPVELAIVDKWKALAAPIANRAVATITGDIRRSVTRDAESADLIADAQADRTKANGAVMALMNIPAGSAPTCPTRRAAPRATEW